MLSFRPLLVVLAALATTLALTGPAGNAAAATAPSAPVVASCDSPPDSPDATPENRDAFVRLWSARMADQAWLQHYADLATVPADIRAEGFHDMGPQTQLWLDACLLDAILANGHETPTAAQRASYLFGLNLVIFGKHGISQMRHQLNASTPPATAPATSVPQDLSGDTLQTMATNLAEQPSLVSARQPAAHVAAPATTSLHPAASPPSITDPITAIPVVGLLLDAVDAVLQLVSQIQGKLFTLPVINLLSPLFYKVCAEGPSLPLSCSVSLPVAVPVPVDVTGDHLPDLLAQLEPQTNLVDVGASFLVQRLTTGGSLPDHVFAVYDTPVAKKRIEVGFDGRASTLGFQNSVTVMLKNAVQALSGDVQVAADVHSQSPGSTEALTFAIKSLSGTPATEQDPLAAAVQMSPFPHDVKVGAHFTQGVQSSHDSFTVDTTAPTTVDAVVDQKSTSTQVKSDRQFTAHVDQLPSHVAVDLTQAGKHQSVDYTANASINVVQVTDTSTPDLSKPTEVDNSLYEADGVPTAMHVAMDDNLVTYTSSASIPRVYADVQRKGGDHITAEVKGIPTSAQVLLDGKNSVLNWQANAPTTSAAAIAHLTAATLGTDRAFDADVTVDSIPATWNAAWANGNVLFNAPGAGIGSIVAHVTNHAAYHVLSGDHLSAYYDKASGDLDASLEISDLHKAQFTKIADTGDGGGFEAALDMGDQSTFSLAGEVHTPDGDVVADGHFDHLPSTIDLTSIGGHITYSGNTNPDLTLAVGAGKADALAVTPVPPSVHGVAVRDGAVGTDKAVRAALYLTGLPTGLDLNTETGVYQVTGYHPTNPNLVVDAVLNSIVDHPLSLELQQIVPTASPVDFTFGPFLSSTASDGTHDLSLAYTASQPLGSLTAEATYDGTDDAQLMISSIPASIHVNAGFGADQKTVGVAMSQGISDITASYKKVGAANFAASVHLHDVPSSVSLQLGRGSASTSNEDITAPDFTFTASAPGLDIEAFASAEIADPADIKAAAHLKIVDMGKTVTGQLEGTSVHITSTPATHSFLLTAAGTVHKNVDLGFDSSGFTNEGNLDVNVDVKQLSLGFDDASDLTLDLGITTGLRGDFGNFSFGLDTDTTVGIVDHLKFVIDWPDPLGTTTIHLFDIDTTVPLHNVIDGFHVNSNTFGSIFDIPFFDFGVGYCSVDFSARPGPGTTYGGTALSLGPPPDDGTHTPAWLITPDPDLLSLSLPDFALDLIAYFESPYGHEISADAGCHSRV